MWPTSWESTNEGEAHEAANSVSRFSRCQVEPRSSATSRGYCLRYLYTGLSGSLERSCDMAGVLASRKSQSLQSAVWVTMVEPSELAERPTPIVVHMPSEPREGGRANTISRRETMGRETMGRETMGRETMGIDESRQLQRQMTNMQSQMTNDK